MLMYLRQFLVPALFIVTTVAVTGGEQGKERTVDGKTVKAWAGQLADKNWKVEAEACEALGAFGPLATVAVPDLLNTVAHGRSSVHGHALKAMKDIGPEAVVPAMQKVLRDPNATTKLKVAAIDALRMLGSEAKSAAPDLVQAMLTPIKEYQIGFHASQALVNIGPDAVPHMLKAINAPETTKPKRLAVFNALGRMGTNAGSAAADLAQIVLKGDDVEYRKHALEILIQVGAGDKKLAKDLQPLLEDKDLSFKSAAYFATLGPDGKDALPVLLKQLREADSKKPPFDANVPNPAIGHLRKLGKAVVPVIPDLIDMIKSGGASAGNAAAVLASQGEEAIAPLMEVLRNEKGGSRDLALNALAGIGPKAKEALPIAQAMFKDAPAARKTYYNQIVGKLGGDPAPWLVEQAAKAEMRNLRLRALIDLRLLGPRAHSTTAELLKLVKDEDRSIRIECLVTLGVIGADDKRVVRALVDAMEDKEFGRSGIVDDVIRKLGPEALPAILDALETKDVRTRNALFGALREMKKKASSAQGKLLELLKSDIPEMRIGAALALGSINPDPAKAVPALLASLKDDDRSVRGCAAHSLGELHEEPGKVVPALIEALKDKDRYVVGHAGTALGAFSKDAQPAIPALLALLDPKADEDPPVGVIHALGKVGADPKVAVPALIKVVEVSKKGTLLAAIHTLEKFGDDARPAIPAIREALKRNPGLGGQAGEMALKRIAKPRLDPW